MLLQGVELHVILQRIGGTATGGGTFWGLGRLLTGENGFDNLLVKETAFSIHVIKFFLKAVSHRNWRHKVTSATATCWSRTFMVAETTSIPLSVSAQLLLHRALAKLST